jgi:hypothetical protein
MLGVRGTTKEVVDGMRYSYNYFIIIINKHAYAGQLYSFTHITALLVPMTAAILALSS